MAATQTRCKDPPGSEAAPRRQRQQPGLWNPAALSPVSLVFHRLSFLFTARRPSKTHFGDDGRETKQHDALVGGTSVNAGGQTPEPDKEERPLLCGRRLFSINKTSQHCLTKRQYFHDPRNTQTQIAQFKTTTLQKIHSNIVSFQVYPCTCTAKGSQRYFIRSYTSTDVIYEVT